MFSRAILAFYFALTFALFAAAMPGGTPAPVTTTVTVTAPASEPTGGDVCSTGPVQCCQSVGQSSDPVFGLLLGLLGIVIDGVDALLGLECSPITIVGLGSGNACSANVVCCENNSIGGLISIGCIPIIL